MELYNAGGIGLSTLSGREQEMAKLENERIEVRAALELKKREEEISNQRQDKLKNLPKTLQEYYLEEVARDTGIKAADDALANRKPSNSPSQLSTNQKIGNFRISSPFGNRLNPFTGQGMESHEGIDIAMPKGTPLYAIVDGKILSVGNNAVAGNFVTLKDSKGTEYTYSHLDSTEVTSGQEVKQGNLIGKSGNTGRSTAPHLHFGVKEQGKFREPVLQELQNAISQAKKISDASIENQDQRIALTLSDLAPSAPSITIGPTNNNAQAGG
jgi:murein DD-endopeptidase MepM/ murein hydrolase activator NlpD